LAIGGFAVWLQIDGFSSSTHKMVEYCEKSAGSDNEEQLGANATNCGTGEMPKYMSLAAQYGLDDDMDIGDSSANMQTIEQEYQAYITASLSPKTVDILKFWEVDDLSTHSSNLLTECCR
jgi:hypothetical protein